MYESIRQIVESRLFAASIASVAGDTRESIVTASNTTASRLNSINSNLNFITHPTITFNSNGLDVFNVTEVLGFPQGFLVTNTLTTTSLAFSNGRGPTIPAGLQFSGNGVRIVLEDADDTIPIEQKVVKWVDLINAESTLGFTATGLGRSITLITKSITATSSILSIGTDSFGASTLVDGIPVGTRVIIGTGLSFPLFLESRDFTQPTTGDKNWGVLFLNSSSVVGREFGNVQKGLKTSGSIRIKIYAPRNAGTKLIRTMADNLNGILSYSAGSVIADGTSAGGTLLVRPGVLSRVSDDDDGFLSYNLDYIYDYYTSS